MRLWGEVPALRSVRAACAEPFGYRSGQAESKQGSDPTGARSWEACPQADAGLVGAGYSTVFCQGLSRATPAWAKSRVLRVTSWHPCARAVAAMIESKAAMDLPVASARTTMSAQTDAVALSIDQVFHNAKSRMLSWDRPTSSGSPRGAWSRLSSRLGVVPLIRW